MTAPRGTCYKTSRCIGPHRNIVELELLATTALPFTCNDEPLRTDAEHMESAL